jgi:hypothetical protein
LGDASLKVILNSIIGPILQTSFQKHCPFPIFDIKISYKKREEMIKNNPCQTDLWQYCFPFAGNGMRTLDNFNKNPGSGGGDNILQMINADDYSVNAREVSVIPSGVGVIARKHFYVPLIQR